MNLLLKDTNMNSAPIIPHPPNPWNTTKLGHRVGIDAVAAGAAGVLVAPLITMIDQGIMENASGRNTLRQSLKRSVAELVGRPGGFLTGRPFVLIFSLYFGTYLTANTTDTLSSTLHATPASTTTSGTPKFLATSAANLALCLYKDNQFTKLFSTPASCSSPSSSLPPSPTRAVRLPTFALFTLRDCLTIFASFNLPPLLAPHLRSALSDTTQRYVSAATAAQFLAPAAIQLLSTPLHLLGLDLYNRPRLPAPQRAARVLRDWGLSCAARVGRIVPAFGVGGVVNAKVRAGGMRWVEEEGGVLS